MERNLYLIEDGGELWYVAAESYPAALELWRDINNIEAEPTGSEPDEMALLAEAEDVLIQEAP